MKKIILAAVLSVLATAANADDYETARAKKYLCDSMSQLAESAMTARQSGVDINILKKSLITQNNRTEGGVYDLIDIAYGSPIYPDPQRKAEEIEDYKEASYLACLNLYF